MSQHPEQIEDAIENTRQRIENRLNELSGQVSASRVVKSFLGSSNGSTADSLDAVVTKARENPVPTLLIGAGLAALFFSTSTSDSKSEHHVDGDGRDPAERIGAHATELKQRAAATGDDLAEAASNAKASAKAQMETVRQSASSLAGKASGYMSEKADTVAEATSNLKQRADTIGDTAAARIEASQHRLKHQARQAGLQADSAMNWVKDNPVPAGLAALALGAAAASFLSTRNSNGAAGSSDERGAAAASRSMHAQARDHEEDPDNKGANRFTDFQEAARSGRTQAGTDGAIARKPRAVSLKAKSKTRTSARKTKPAKRSSAAVKPARAASSAATKTPLSD